jgi:hypothetical protein
MVMTWEGAYEGLTAIVGFVDPAGDCRIEGYIIEGYIIEGYIIERLHSGGPEPQTGPQRVMSP